MKPKIKLIAVAKDEAAYLPEWVFHHKFLGFDFIHVYVNRTTDNSHATLEWLSNEFSGVSFSYLDWIDTCPQEAQFQLQYIAYASAFDEAKRSGDVDYVVFLDIDEFWTPKSMAIKIQDVVQKYPKAAAMSFEWINEFGSEQAFSALPQIITGRINPLVKTVISVNAPVECHGYHKPKLAPESKHILMDGAKFEADEELSEGLRKELIHLRPVMIIHRLFRSPLEYVSLLHRGRPSDDIQLKLNRGGYNHVMGREVDFALNAKNYAAYQAELQSFLDKPELQALLTEARDFVKNRYNRALQSVTDIPMKYVPAVAKVFRGCSVEELAVVQEKLQQRIDKSHKIKFETVMSLAEETQKYNSVFALMLLEKALQIRPDGPRVKEKIAKLKAKLESE